MMTAIALLLALCLAVGVYLLRRRLAFQRRSNQQEEQIQQLEQRLMHIAQQGTEQVTQAVLQLEERLEQADATIEELRYRTQLAEGMLWQQEQPKVVSEQAREAFAAPTASAPAVFSQKLAVAAYQLSQQAATDTDIATDAAPAAAVSRERPQISAAVHSDEAGDGVPPDKLARYEDVAALVAQGMGEIAIAKQLDLGVGEVRLAKKLLRNKEKA